MIGDACTTDLGRLRTGNMSTLTAAALRTVDIGTLVLAAFLSFTVGVIVGSLWVAFCANDDFKEFRNSAIEAGAAEWTIDAKTGEREFRWIAGSTERPSAS